MVTNPDGCVAFSLAPAMPITACRTIHVLCSCLLTCSWRGNLAHGYDSVELPLSAEVEDCSLSLALSRLCSCSVDFTSSYALCKLFGARGFYVFCTRILRRPAPHVQGSGGGVRV